MSEAKSVIFTSYFSKKAHPQHDPHVEGKTADGRVKQNDISYIERWYDSVRKLGLEARIFCDNLTPEFIKEYETNKIKFVMVEPPDYENIDSRHFCYRDYLQKNKFDYVFLTDSSDVIITADPSKLFSDFPNIKYFVGKDSLKLCQFPYLNFHQQVGFQDYFMFFINQFDWDLINMGVIGARYHDILPFLEKFCHERIKIGNPTASIDMWIGNYIFRREFGDCTLIGEPLTSNFKQYEFDRKDVYFIHK